MRMKKRGIVIALTAVISAISLLSDIDSVVANKSLEQRIQNIQQERAQTQQEKKNRQNELTNLQKERSAVQQEIATIDHKMADTHNQIRVQQQEIQEVEAHIAELQAELERLEMRIRERDELLKSRARSMYQTGGTVSYLEVLLGSKSFGDFIDRISALSLIAEQDRNILEAHIEDQRLVDETKQLVEQELEKLEQSLANLEKLMAQLEEQKKEKDRIVQSLLAQEEDIHDLIGELENKEQILAQQEIAIKQELAAWKARQQAGQVPQVVSGNGMFLRPAAGTLTSSFGTRVHPISGRTKLHRGIDIANSVGTPIYAAEAGTVITASYESGYGNYVMISHNIGGQVYTTLYGHMSAIHVSTGQRVSRGQQIGLMGSTGASTGSHLHFEVHKGPWNGDSNAVNPLGYIQ